MYSSINTFEDFGDCRGGMDVRFDSCYELLKYNELRHIFTISARQRTQ